MGLNIKISNNSFSLINVYLPCDNRKLDSLIEYKNICAQLQVIIEEQNINKLIIAGDYNADPFKGRFWSELTEFKENTNLIIADQLLPIESYTYLSPAHGSTSWLDHVLVSSFDLVENVRIMYGESISDHIPLSFNIVVPENIAFTNNINTCVNNLIRWDKITDGEKLNYRLAVCDAINDFTNDGLICRDSNCNSEMHKRDLSIAYDFLVATLKECADIYTIKTKERNFKSIPGWSQNCKQCYLNAKKFYFVWDSNGRIRSGSDYEQMKISKLIFKKALSDCKRNEITLRNEKLASAFAKKNKKEFWKDVKKMNPKIKNPISKMDGATDSNIIVNIFEEKFKSIFVDNNCQTMPRNYNQNLKQIKDLASKSRFRILDYTIVNAINSLNDCLGIDGLHSNHFKLFGNDLSSFLSNLFSSFLSHGYLPKNMLRGEIKPIIKENLGKFDDSSNCRPVTISSGCFKIFEYYYYHYNLQK